MPGAAESREPFSSSPTSGPMMKLPCVSTRAMAARYGAPAQALRVQVDEGERWRSVVVGRCR